MVMKMSPNYEVEDSIIEVIKDLRERIEMLERKEVTVAELSEISGDMGLVQAGEIRVHSDPKNAVEPGEGFSGVRIVGVFEDGGVNYAIVGLNDDVLQAGMSADDGTILAGAGAVILDADGITAIAGKLANWIIEQYQISTDSGNVFINSNTPAIGLGATGYKTGVGIWLGKDGGVYKFYAGDATGDNYLAFDGSVLDVKGIVAEVADIEKLVKVGASSPYIYIDGVNKTIQTSDFQAGSRGYQLKADGNAEFNNITARGAIRTSVFEANQLTATAGTFGVFKSAGVLLNDLTESSGDYTLDIKDPDSGHAQIFAVDDILRIKTGTADSWYKVVSATDETTHYQYVCSLEDGDTDLHTAGCAVADYGQDGDGFLIMTADDANAPFYSVRTHDGTPWSGTHEVLRLGNLQDISGFNPGEFGLAGMNLNSVVQFGIDNTGSAFFCNRNATIDSRGITGTDLLDYMVQQSATWEGEERFFQFGLEELNGKPVGTIAFYNPDDEGSPPNLITKGTAEDGDLTGWTAETESAGKFGVSTAEPKAGTYSYAWKPDIGSDSLTKTLLLFNGDNDSTTITDECGRAWTRYGDTKLKTAVKKFGSASCYFDGAGDHLRAADSDDWNTGSGNYTIEFWIYRPSDSYVFDICCQGNALEDSATQHYLHYDNMIHYHAYRASTYTQIEMSSPLDMLPSETWVHVAIVRNGSSFKMYVGGAERASATSTSTLSNATGYFYIGRTGDAYTDYFKGYLDDFRFSKGIARYTSNFTPPVRQLALTTTGVMRSQRYEVVGGTNYYVSAWVNFKKHASQSFNGTHKLEVRWYDHASAGSLISTTFINAITGADEYQNLFKTVTAPANALSCEILFSSACTNSYGVEVLLDSVEMTDASTRVFHKLQLTDDDLLFNGDSVGQAYIAQGRLTLESGVPVSTSDQTDKTTLYYTPFNGNFIDIYDGSAWKRHEFTERSLAIGALTASKPHDIFIYDNSGTLTLQAVEWTNATTRATALTTQDGVQVLTGATNKRYLGTIYIDSGQKCQDTTTHRFVWNYYNKYKKLLLAKDSTAHTYNGAIRDWNNSTATQTDAVIGIYDTINFSADAVLYATNTDDLTLARMAVDGLTPAGVGVYQLYNRNTYQASVSSTALINVSAGYHYFSVREQGADVGSTFDELYIRIAING